MYQVFQSGATNLVSPAPPVSEKKKVGRYLVITLALVVGLDVGFWVMARMPLAVAIAGCGVCHTDLGYYYDGVRTNAPLPLALGHEISGRVVAAGNGAVTAVTVDNVVLNPTNPPYTLYKISLNNTVATCCAGTRT